MPDMLRSFILTLAVLQARNLQPSSASSETVKKFVEMESSALAHTDPSVRYENTNTDVNGSEKLTNLRSNVQISMLSRWVNALKNNMEHFSAESNDKDQKTFSNVLLDRIRQAQVKTRTDNREFPATELFAVGKPWQKGGSPRLGRGALSFATGAPDSDGLHMFIKPLRSGESISVMDEDEDKNCDYENTNVRSGQLENRSNCKFQGISESSRKRSKRDSRNGGVNHSRNLSAPRRLFEAMLKLRGLEEEDKVVGSFDNDDIITRKARGVPVTFGEDENEMGHFVRSERDRLSRMPVTFGKRGTHERFDTFLMRTLEDVLNRHFLDLDRDDEIGVDSDDDSVSFIRTSKGSLHRMPMTFGKRASALLNNINDEESYTMPVAFERSLSSTQKHIVPLIERSHISPFLWRHQNSWKHKPEEQTQFELPENGDFTRIQRSKLERMPLTFGKRYHISNDNNGDIVNVHNIKQRSRLERMPVSYGKRSLTVGTMVYLSALSQILSTGGREALRPRVREAFRDLLFESNSPKETVQTNI